MTTTIDPVCKSWQGGIIFTTDGLRRFQWIQCLLLQPWHLSQVSVARFYCSDISLTPCFTLSPCHSCFPLSLCKVHPANLQASLTLSYSYTAEHLMWKSYNQAKLFHYKFVVSFLSSGIFPAKQLELCILSEWHTHNCHFAALCSLLRYLSSLACFSQHRISPISSKRKLALVFNMAFSLPSVSFPSLWLFSYFYHGNNAFCTSNPCTCPVPLSHLLISSLLTSSLTHFLNLSLSLILSQTYASF